MGNPLNRLKYLPWRSLAQSAIVTLLIVLVAEFLLIVGSSQIPVIATVLATILTPPIGIVTTFVVAFGIGALAVVILEHMNRSAMNAASLWGLVLCLLIAFLLRRLIPLPAVLFEVESLPFTLVILGVFWRGQPYWKSFRRW